MQGKGGSLLQISDPHFGTEQPGAVQALQRLVALRQPALVVVSGDVTQRATAAQFARAKAFVDSLAPLPVLAIPGNHDIPLFDLWARLRKPYARFEAALGAVHDHRFISPTWHVLMLNTTRWWRHKNGEISEAQLQASVQSLHAAAPGALKVVVTHQPVAVPALRDRPDLLQGAQRAVAAWHAAGADLVLGGHIHLPCVLSLLPLLPLRPTLDAPRAMWAVQAGTAVSTRVRQGTLNSVTELLPGPRSCSVRFWDWQPGQHSFMPRPDIALPLAGPPRARVEYSMVQGVAPHHDR